MRLTNSRLLSFILNVILDLLFLVVLLFSIVMAILALSSHKTLLGYRLGIVQSESMKDSGLEVGDIVFIESKNSYNVGDIIAFYRTPSNYEKDPSEVEDLDKKQIWIHEIIDIKFENGTYYYLTKGSSNTNDDGYYVPYSYVIGIGKPLNAFWNSTISFIISRVGIICLIIVPCIIMLIYLTWELIMIITSEPFEKKAKFVKEGYNYINQPQRQIRNIYIKIIPTKNNQSIKTNIDYSKAKKIYIVFKPVNKMRKEIIKENEK